MSDISIVFQHINPEGLPDGGMTFRAPDARTLAVIVDEHPAPTGWTRHAVASEADVIWQPRAPADGLEAVV